ADKRPGSAGGGCGDAAGGVAGRREGLASRTCHDPAVSGAAIPSVLAVPVAVGLILGEEWLQRRTRQSWWAIDQLVRAVMYAALTGLLAYVGHPLLALAIAALAAFEIVLARRSWVKRGSRDLLERYRMELE